MPEPHPTENHVRLKRFIEHEADTLIATLSFYVLRGNVAREQPVDVAAIELLNDVTIEALEHAGRFDPGGQPMAWLLGIAANLIRRRQVDLGKQERREPLVSDLRQPDEAALSEEELFDRLAAISEADPSDDLETQACIGEFLSDLSEADRRIVKLAILHDLDGETVARKLDITPGAARVRLHRALERLRNSPAARRKDGQNE